MSAKFFTWTKGDRHCATDALRSGKVVQIPVECIEGLDYARTKKGSGKANRRPPPLLLDTSPTPSSKHSSRTNNSIALQDAAVKSATSLITVMNDMLRSPHLSTHLSANLISSHIHSAGSPSDQRRPRAHTAPSTPIMDPVELPGSLPEDLRAYLEAPQSRSVGEYLLPQYHGEKIVRSRSSPQETTYPLPNRRGRMSVESFYHNSTFAQPNLISPRCKTGSPPTIDASPPNYEHNATQLGRSQIAAHDTLRRPSLSILSLELPKPSPLSTPLLTSQPRHVHTVVPPRVSHDEIASFHANDILSAHGEVNEALDEQISRMREAHDAHVHSLEEAHEKDIASHKYYIRFLERRQRLHFTNEKHSLHDHTAQSSRSGTESNISADSATPFQPTASLLSQKSHSQASVEAKNGDFRPCCTAHAQAMDLRKERDELRETVDRNDRRASRLKDMVRKSKESEEALRNTIATLEARLVAANNERTDVLEGFDEATRKLHTSAQREKAITQELKDLRSRVADSHSNVDSTPRRNMPVVSRTGHKRTVSDFGGAFTMENSASHQLRDLQRIILEKDAYIHRLQAAKPTGSPSMLETVNPQQSERIIELEREVEKYKESLSIAEADSERYNSLLHNELRRQSRQLAEKKHAPIPQIDAEASAIAMDKVAQLKAESYDATLSGHDTRDKDALQSSSLTTSLERELEYCIKELIVYKLDLRGCKKDLKKANAKIETLQATSSLRPPTPDQESPSSVRSNASGSSYRKNQSSAIYQSMPTANPLQPGLGIAVPEESITPEKNPGAIMPLPCVPATPPPRSTTMSSPPTLRSRTPLGAHKKLPKPPSSVSTQTSLALTGSPPVKTRRVEALRSFSESMIANTKAMPPLDSGSCD